jgi:hypothetical protein
VITSLDFDDPSLPTWNNFSGTKQLQDLRNTMIGRTAG